jgi:predicted ABC-type transport system involved in lysophospholipase L1 biosynthesis ATPase subunit
VTTSVVLEIDDVVKAYGGLRPLRIQRLSIVQGERVAIVGLDQVVTQVFVNLVTGATLPDAGVIKLFGRATSSISESQEWLALIDRLGIVSERVVLLEGMTPIQNLAIPFGLEIEPPPEETIGRARHLATEVRLAESTWLTPVARLGPLDHLRVRLGRALALDPAILLLEHISAGLSRIDVDALGTDLRALAARRGVAIVMSSADDQLAQMVASRTLTLNAATGRLSEGRFRLRVW